MGNWTEEADRLSEMRKNGATWAEVEAEAQKALQRIANAERAAEEEE